jgi:hypothetical protein
MGNALANTGAVTPVERIIPMVRSIRRCSVETRRKEAIYE